MKSCGSRHTVDIIAVLLLLVLFTASALAVVLLGVKVYEKTVSNMGDNFNTRTSLSYITEMIRQNDSGGNISAAENEGISVLTLKKEYDGIPYTTYVYAENDSLMELTQKSDMPFRSSSGRTIMQIRSFSVIQDGSLLHLSVTDPDGSTAETSVAVRSMP
jgi:hypothetical protein